MKLKKLFLLIAAALLCVRSQAQLVLRPWTPGLRATLPAIQGKFLGQVALKLNKCDLNGDFGAKLVAPVVQYLEKKNITPETFNAMGAAERQRWLTNALNHQVSKSNRRASKMSDDFAGERLNPRRLDDDVEEADKLLIFEGPYLADKV